MSGTMNLEVRRCFICMCKEKYTYNIRIQESDGKSYYKDACTNCVPRPDYRYIKPRHINIDQLMEDNAVKRAVNMLEHGDE